MDLVFCFTDHLNTSVLMLGYWKGTGTLPWWPDK